MPISTTHLPSAIPAFAEVSEVVAHFMIHGIGTQARLTAPHKCTNERVRNYFYKQNCKVSIQVERNGVRLITCNGFNSTGRHVKRENERKRLASKRRDHEKTLGELLETKGLDVGETLFVKGNANHMGTYLREKFGEGAISMSQNGEGWNIKRLR